MKLIENVKNKGFTLIELVIVMAVIALIMSIAIPNFRSMQQEGSLTKAEGDLDTIKIACTSFWRNNAQVYPANVHAALTGASPSIITKPLSDPWKTDATNNTYGYTKGTDATFGDYFFVFTKGLLGDTAPAWDAVNQRVNYTGTGRVVSNAPILKQ